MLRFYGAIIQRMPGLLFQALVSHNKFAGVAFLLLVLAGPLVNQLRDTGVMPGMSTPEWWPLAVVLLLLVWGFLKANYERFASLEQSLDAETKAREAAETALREQGEQQTQVLIQRELERRGRLLGQLRQKYILSQGEFTAGMAAGLEPLPKVWVDAELAALGEQWRQDMYR